MRGRFTGNSVAGGQPTPATPPSSLIRAMANTLCDRGVRVITSTDVEICTHLILAGFSGKDINEYYDAVTSMAAMRQAHDHK